MDHLNAVLARIEEIKDRFGADVPAARVAMGRTAPIGQGPQGTLQPYFPSALADAMRSPGVSVEPMPAAFDDLINASAERNNVPPALLKGLVRAESSFKPGQVSRAGAMGLTQLMPATARSLGVSDPFDPAQSIEGGAKYLRQQMDRFGGDVSLALAAYNAGAGAVVKYGGVPPYTETQNYVKRVLEYSRAYGLGEDR